MANAPIVSIAGEDTLVLSSTDGTMSDYNFVGFADASYVDLQFPNELTTSKPGKNGNTIIAKNATGRLAEMAIRVLRGSDDDIKMQATLANQIADLTAAGFVSGTYTKTMFAGVGVGAKKVSDTYTLNNGVIHKQPVVMSNADGDVNQSVVVYNVRFGSVDRALV